MNVLLILNDPPYGTERSYNGLRLAGSLAHRDGYYHLDRMIQAAGRRGAAIGCCGTCLDARGLTEDRLVEGARRSSLDELTDWVVWADQTITF